MKISDDYEVALIQHYVDTLIRIPTDYYKALITECKTPYRQWVKVQYNNVCYVGRPLPTEGRAFCIPRVLSFPTDVKDASMEFLDKLTTVSEITVESFDKELPYGFIMQPVCKGMRYFGRNGHVAVVMSMSFTDGVEKAFGLCHSNTKFSIHTPIHTPHKLKPAGCYVEAAKCFKKLLSSGVKSILLTGAKGIGKYFVAEDVLEEEGIPFRFLPGIGELHMPMYVEELLVEINHDQNVEKMALVIHDFDLHGPNRKNIAGEDAAFQAALFRNGIQDLLTMSSKIVIIGMTARPSEIDKNRFSSFINNQIEICSPGVNERAELLRQCLSGMALPEEDVLWLGERSHGFLFADIYNLSNIITNKNTQQKLDRASLESCLRQAASNIHKQFKAPIDASVTWESLGGLAKVRPRIEEAVEDPIRYAAEFKKLGISAPKGILLYGPPGCSKTSIAKAVANACGLPFFTMDVAGIFSCFVGESEATIRALFATARSSAPSIIFIDEIEVIVGKRGNDSGRDLVQERLLTTFLTEIDGVEQMEGVLVIGATNRKDAIDEALLRPGRFDELVELALPNADDREDILRKVSFKTPGSDKVDWRRVAQECEGASAADLRNIVSLTCFDVVSCSTNSLNSPTTQDYINTIKEDAERRIKSGESFI